jgi:hypothetical protein
MEHGVDAAIKLRNTFEHDWKRAVGAEQTYQMQDPSYADRMDLSQAQFLCSWREHTPGNPRPLDICSPSNALARQVVEDREAAAQIVKEAAVHDKQHREKAKQAAAALAARQEVEFNQTAGQMSNDRLCHIYSQTRYNAARAELTRRHALTPAEWDLVDHRLPDVGMSKLALLCSMGPTKGNRTVTAGGETIQYVYGDTFVYVTNGVVTGFQDSSYSR